MKTTWFTTLLIAASLGNVSFVAQGQTARIAYRSHSGSAAAVEDLDNFGVPQPVFRADTLVATSDTTAEAHGRVSAWGEEGERSTRTIYYGKLYYHRATGTGPQSRAEAVKELQESYPRAKLIGFDTAAVVPVPAPTPVTPLRKEKTKRKRHQEALLHSAPLVPPRHPGVWLALATILGLGAAGLLLGDKPRPVSGKAA